MATMPLSQSEYKEEENMSELVIKDLHVTVETDDGIKEILRGVDLTITSGQLTPSWGQMVPVNQLWLMQLQVTLNTQSHLVQ